MNFFFKMGAVLAAAALGTTGVVFATATPASAAGSCSLVAPTRVAITAPYRGNVLGLERNCAASRVAYASWEAYHPTQGWQVIAIFDGHGRQRWDLYDFEPLGVWTWRPSLAYDVNHREIAQNSVRTDVRWGSRGALSVVRSGATVKLTSIAARYTPSVRKFARWSYVKGTVQYRKPGTSRWIYLKTMSARRDGKVTYTYRSSAAREYRFVVPRSSTTWGSVSATVRR